MPNILTTEQELAKVLPITPRKLRKLRLSKRIPFVKVDRYTRLYDVDKVVTALEQLEIKPKQIVEESP
jgi:hypothetical protein